jgi:hypothetical protein
MNVADLRKPEQKVEECAKILACQSAESNGKLGHQVLETGIFKPDEINCNINYQVKKRIPLFKHQKKISGRPSVSDISSGDQALDYGARKVATTPTTGRYVANNYADLLQKNGYSITGSAIKKASRPFKKKRVVAPSQIDDCAKELAYIPANEKIKLGQQVLATGVFKAGEINRDINQRIKKRIPLFEHQKKISGRPSIGNIVSRAQALDYVTRKVAATPTKAHYVASNYVVMLKENGHCITDSAIKMASRKSQLGRPEEQVEWMQSEEEQVECMQSEEEQVECMQSEAERAGLLKDCIVDQLMPCISHHLPFILDDMIHNEFDCQKVERVLMNLVGDIHAKRESRLTAMLVEGTTEAEAHHDTQQNRNSYPTLSCYGIPFHDPRVRGNLLQELYTYNQEETGSSTMRFVFQNHATAALVMIPQSSQLESMKKKNRRHNYVSEIMNSLDKDGTRPEETRKDFLTMLARSDDCREHFRNVAHSEGLSLIERLDEETSFAIQSDSNLNYTQMRSLCRNLLAAVGNPIFSGEQKTKASLGSVVPELDIGCFVDGRKRIRWHCKKVDQVLLLFLDSLGKPDMSNFDHIDISVSIDHGKGFLRASLVVLLCGMDSKAEMAGCFALASAKCKGDSYDILQSTFAPKINEALHRIKNCGYKISVFHRPDGTVYSKLGIEPDDESHDSIQDFQVEQFISGDLKFFMMATQREHADRVWCFYCNLMNKEWKSEAFKVGEEWSNDAWKNYVESIRENYNSLNAFEKKGCKICHLLMFDAIDFDHFVLPVLHILLGLVNDIYKNLLAELQAGYEAYTDAFVELESEWTITAANHRDAKDEKAEHERLYCNYVKYLKVSCFLSTQIRLWHL